MSDGFAPSTRFMESDFAPTSLIAALDAARAEAARIEPPPPEPPGPDPMEETLRAVAAAAREDGFAAGRASMAQETAQRASESLAQVVKILGVSQQASAEIAAEACHGMAGLVIAMLEAALPGLAARQGAQLIGDFAERLRPALAFLPEAELRLNPALVEEVRALVGDLPVKLVPDAALAQGDARAVWQGGGAEFDLAARRAAIMDVMRAAGLDPEAEEFKQG